MGAYRAPIIEVVLRAEQVSLYIKVDGVIMRVWLVVEVCVKQRVDEEAGRGREVHYRTARDHSAALNLGAQR